MDYNHVIEEILLAKDFYIKNTGRNAKYVYVDNSRFQAMKNSDHYKLNLHHYDSITKKIVGRFCCGLKVIVTTEEDHLNVC